ncbi:MAG: LON peptidase substrate-binding domain-containing protein [Acetobacteraceae bacterium]|nr:LON peptidase substrate-binding domain-containing protein [Acetobacteraceae bacterium]
MTGFHPTADRLPDVFPVFPLTGALLLPQGKLPLNIFEPRYVAMVDEALRADRMFGMIQPKPGVLRGETGPALFSVGCLGRLTSFSETEDGRYLITLTGVVRFTVERELEMRHGFRRVRGDYTLFQRDLDLSPQPTGINRETLTAELRAYFGRSGMEANWDAIARLADETLLTTLCMVCPFEPAEKQAMLEAPTDADRAAALLALLRMGGRSTGTAVPPAA